MPTTMSTHYVHIAAQKSRQVKRCLSLFTFRIIQFRIYLLIALAYREKVRGIHTFLYQENHSRIQNLAKHRRSSLLQNY